MTPKTEDKWLKKRKQNLSGQKFGKLTVIRPIGIKHYPPNSVLIYECLCECGNLVERNARVLNDPKHNKQSCVKCKIPGNKIQNRVLAIKKRIYVDSIKRKNRILKETNHLPFDVFCTMIDKECSYCGRTGVSFYNESRGRRGERASNTKVRYNGIDRIDSNAGYTLKIL